MGRKPAIVTLVFTIAVVLAGWFFVSEANAAKAINSTCGMHIGSLMRRNQGGSLYHFRIGPKDAYLGTARPTTCAGKIRIRKNGRAGALAWQTYSMKGFNDHTALLIGTGTATVVGCGGVAKAIVGAVTVLVGASTDEVAYPGLSLAAGAFGCGVGAHVLFNYLPNGPTTLNKVRMIK